MKKIEIIIIGLLLIMVVAVGTVSALTWEERHTAALKKMPALPSHDAWRTDALKKMPTLSSFETWRTDALNKMPKSSSYEDWQKDKLNVTFT